VGDIPVRFHQSIAFLPTSQVVPLARASDELGYGGIYVSDHVFNPRALASRYTYSVREDGAPGWEPETPWPDPMCVISGLATVTEHLTFTTGVYIAPLRDLITVARTVGTAAVLSNNRVRLGVGVGWCKEEFDQTGQDFASRGPRLNEMISALRALWQGGWVEFHGDYYDVPECQIEPAPLFTEPLHRGQSIGQQLVIGSSRIGLDEHPGGADEVVDAGFGETAEHVDVGPFVEGEVDPRPDHRRRALPRGAAARCHALRRLDRGRCV
jgi:alkanesulfonate monooxygenase SsuD/methylene tetrahydromethanopterin reductase-like flavin-dependent oxidoreductase (luciferase family)